MALYYVTWEQHSDAAKGRFRAPYATIEEAKVQAQHDLNVNDRVDVEVEDEGGKLVWKPK